METMERTALRSREIAIAGYDPHCSKLEITFRSGGVYHYSEVPEEIFKRFLSAPSQGKYFEENIKHKFPYRRVS